jgi:hypothetical protein
VAVRERQPAAAGNEHRFTHVAVEADGSLINNSEKGGFRFLCIQLFDEDRGGRSEV